MPSAPAYTIAKIVDLHRRQLAGVVEVLGARRFRKVYEQSRVDLEKKLGALTRAGKGQRFEAHHVRQALVQVTTAIQEVERGIEAHLGATGKIAVKLAPRHIVDTVTKLEGHFGAETPVIQARQAAVFLGADRKVPPSLLDRYKRSSRFYGAPVVKKIREQLALSIVQGESVDEAVARVAGTSGVFAGAGWRAERIVRTELSYSYGVSKQAGLVELGAEVPRMKKRLVATFDDRTGQDSEDLDGQTVDVAAPFVWKVKNAKGNLTGEVVEYMHPPNRPNDREVMIPWLAGWPAGAVSDSGPVTPTTAGLG